MNKVIHNGDRQLVRVALDVPLESLFDYWGQGVKETDIGRRVTVPFGHQHLVGVIIELPSASLVDPDRIKPILEIHHDTPVLSPRFIEFLGFAARYYHHPLGQVIGHALPPALRDPTPWSSRRPRRAKASPEQKMLHPHHALSVQQKTIADIVTPAILKQTFAPFLLHGVTGSGKTELYFEWIEKVLSLQQKALILVPEINLTPQLEARIAARFRDIKLISLHSRQSRLTRAERWLELFTPGPALIIGTRLAILSPAPDLGLIIVDEEHDPSFKQQEGLRYSARDLAVVRAQAASCPLVLGSATPSLESLLQAKKGKYQLLKLEERANPNACLPQIDVIDLRRASRIGGLTEAACERLADTLQKGEQALVFINRRGYSPVLWCNSCGWFAACPRCQGKLVFYRKTRKTLCHLCGYTRSTPSACPSCGNSELIAAGEGTERLEETLQGRFPNARILRVDTDTMSAQKSFEELREALISDQVDILVGTQMLAKGHDFPNLTTVIVVNPDQALFSVDFRAEERLFAQLIQVAGRAGRRDKPGRVLVQTAKPDHPLFSALTHHDFDGYADHLLQARKAFGFPPYTFQALLQASHRDETALKDFLCFCKTALDRFNFEGLTVYDPVPASPPKIALKFRYHLLLQSAIRQQLHPALTELTRIIESYSGPRVQWVLDVDPQEV